MGLAAVLPGEPDRRPVLPYRRLRLASHVIGHSEVEAGIGIGRVQAQGLTIVLRRLVGTAQVCERISQVVVSFGVVGLIGQRLLVVLDCRLVSLLLRQGTAHVQMSQRMIRLHIEGSLEMDDRLLRAVEAQEGGGEVQRSFGGDVRLRVGHERYQEYGGHAYHRHPESAQIAPGGQADQRRQSDAREDRQRGSGRRAEARTHREQQQAQEDGEHRKREESRVPADIPPHLVRDAE